MPKGMKTVEVRLPEELARAAELCGTPLPGFSEFVVGHGVTVHYGIDPAEA